MSQQPAGDDRGAPRRFAFRALRILEKEVWFAELCSDV